MTINTIVVAVIVNPKISNSSVLPFLLLLSLPLLPLALVVVSFESFEAEFQSVRLTAVEDPVVCVTIPIVPATVVSAALVVLV